jgi:Fe-S cluster assembly iron-binding protein IscA
MKITNSAKDQFDEIGGNIRYSLNSGGCSGLIGKWDKEVNKLTAEDVVVYSSCISKLVIDKFSLGHMEDAIIDYTGDFCPQFKIIIPSKQACGCGESFVL